LFIISAPSGTGKSTVIRAVMEQVPNLSFSVSYTTREARGGEVDGVHYHFVDEPTFEEMIRNGSFLEHARVFNRYWYGTSRSQVLDMLSKGTDVVLDIDVQGAVQLMEGLDIPHTTIFLVPPDMTELKRRLMDRGRDTAEEIAERLETARKELTVVSRFDYVVVNDRLADAVAAVEAIVSAERHRTDRIRELNQWIHTIQTEEYS